MSTLLLVQATDGSNVPFSLAMFVSCDVLKRFIAVSIGYACIPQVDSVNAVAFSARRWSFSHDLSSTAQFSRL